MKEFRVIPLANYIRARGEDIAKQRLSGFSCAGLSSEVEEYLRDRAFKHSLRKTSITYLVFADGNDDECLAYYTLTLKPFAINFSRLTTRQKNAMKDMARVSISSEKNAYGISSYLIAQLAMGRQSLRRMSCWILRRNCGRTLFCASERSIPRLAYRQKSRQFEGD